MNKLNNLHKLTTISLTKVWKTTKRNGQRKR